MKQNKILFLAFCLLGLADVVANEVVAADASVSQAAGDGGGTGARANGGDSTGEEAGDGATTAGSTQARTAAAGPTDGGVAAGGVVAAAAELAGGADGAAMTARSMASMPSMAAAFTSAADVDSSLLSASDTDFRAAMDAIRSQIAAVNAGKSEGEKEGQKRKFRICVVTRGMIGGHYMTAMAVKQILERELGDECEVQIIDWDGYSFHSVNNHYKTIETKFGIRKKVLEQNFFKLASFFNINKIISFLVKNRFSKKLISKNYFSMECADKLAMGEFDILISTAPLIHNVLFDYMPKIAHQRPIIISIPTDTDDFLKRLYICSPKVLYSIYSEKQKQLVKNFKCPYFQQISGIPLRKEFWDIRKLSKEAAKSELGLDPKDPVVMVSFGSVGNEEVVEIAKLLKDRQCILICGKNENLKEEIQKLANPKHKVEGFVDGEAMAKRMRAADVIIGKAGGITIWEVIQCESISLSLKEFIYPIEKGNVDFLVKNNLGREVNKTSDLPKVVAEVLSEPTFSSYKQALAAIQNNGAQEVAAIVKDVKANYKQWQDKIWGKKRIVLFKMGETGGHHETAKAIKSELQKEKWSKDWEIEIHNVIKGDNKIYTKAMKFMPSIMNYYNGIRNFILPIMELDALADKGYPTQNLELVILCAPRINTAMKHLEKHNIRSPVFQIPSDFDDCKPLHYFYSGSKKSYYLLGTNYLLKQAKAKNLPNVIPISGMVIRREFSKIRGDMSKAEAKTKLGFADSTEPVICVCYGSGGNYKIKQLATMLKDKNAIFICGAFGDIKQALEKINNPKHKLMGYVDTETMAICLRASEIVIGKPGPGVVSEAWECECVPICEGGKVVMTQEKSVERDIDKNKRGIIVQKLSEIPTAIESILADPTYRNNCSAVQNNALTQVCEVISDVVQNYGWWQERMWGK